MLQKLKRQLTNLLQIIYHTKFMCTITKQAKVIERKYTLTAYLLLKCYIKLLKLIQDWNENH